MVAGLSPSRFDRARVREPTGSPVAMKVSTMAVRISRPRSPIGVPGCILQSFNRMSYGFGRLSLSGVTKSKYLISRAYASTANSPILALDSRNGHSRLSRITRFSAIRALRIITILMPEDRGKESARLLDLYHTFRDAGFNFMHADHHPAGEFVQGLRMSENLHRSTPSVCRCLRLCGSQGQAQYCQGTRRRIERRFFPRRREKKYLSRDGNAGK